MTDLLRAFLNRYIDELSLIGLLAVFVTTLIDVNSLGFGVAFAASSFLTGYWMARN